MRSTFLFESVDDYTCGLLCLSIKVVRAIFYRWNMTGEPVSVAKHKRINKGLDGFSTVLFALLLLMDSIFSRENRTVHDGCS